MEEVLNKLEQVSKKKYLFTVDDYHQLGEAGIIAEDEKVELLFGEIVKMSPIKSPHAGTVKLLNRLFNNRIGKNYIVAVQDPIELDKYSEPEPDLSILKFRDDIYTRSHPKAEDTLLLIEVADTSLMIDREVKIPLYASAGIPEAWIINLQERQIEIFTTPSPNGYSQIHIYRKGETIHHELVGKLDIDEIFIIAS